MLRTSSRSVAQPNKVEPAARKIERDFTMENLILVVHLLVALAIIGLILLQQGKGAEMGASFGGGASQTLFGSSGTGNFFSRMTAVLATVFFITSFTLALVAKQGTGNIEDLPPELQEERSGESSDAGMSDVPVVEEVPADGAAATADEDLPAVENEGAAETDAEAGAKSEAPSNSETE